MYLRMSFSCFLFSQFELLLSLIEEHLNLCQKSMMELFAKIVKALVFYFFHILPKERCSLFHLNGTSRDIHFFVIFSLLFIIILSRKTDWVPHEKIKLTLLRFFDNSLSKYLIFKSFWYELVVLGYFTKIKKWLDFTAHVLQAFSRKIFLTKYSINGPSSIIRRSLLPEISNNVFKFLFSKLML